MRVEIPEQRLLMLWRQLRSRDGAIAGEAMMQLAAAGDQTISLLRDHLPQKKLDEQQLKKLLALLDNPAFRIRDNVTQQLEESLPDIEPALKNALKGSISAEARRRLERLLAIKPVPEGELTEEQRRELRAIHILESIESDAVVQLLGSLVKTYSESFLGREASSAFERLKIRREKTR